MIYAREISFLVSTSMLLACGDANDASLADTNDTEAATADGDEHHEPGDVLGIYAGGFITCVHREPDELRCWGRNSSSGNGMGTASQDYDNDGHRRLATEPGVSVSDGIRLVSNDYSSACLLQDDERVRCWGGIAGRLAGNFDEPLQIGDDETLLEATPLDLGGPLQMVAMGTTHACALLADGDVRCWGDNDKGYLGLGHVDQVGDEGPESIREIPPVSLGGKAKYIETGGSLSCAVLESGDVRCWGNDGPSHLGLPGWEFDVEQDRLGDNEVPSDFPPIAFAAGPVATVHTGGRHVCALHESGDVSCWGELMAAIGMGKGEDNGLAGHGVLPSEAGTVDLGAKATKIATGQVHTCALLEDKAVKCWGDNGDGQLGYGDTAPRGWFETPASYGTISLGGPVKDIAAGDKHTCALMESGELRCWGDNGKGELGIDNGYEDVGDDELPSDAPPVSFQ